MAMKRSGAAGGINSNKVVHTTAHKQEPVPRKVSPAATSQLGGALGNHVMERNTKVQGAAVPMYAGKGYQTPVGPKPCGEGPGAGRQVSRSGSQGQHGPVAGQMPSPARGILGSKGERQP
jgi:hypothetical protein